MLVAAQSVPEDGCHPLRHRDAQPLTARRELVGARPNEARELRFTATERGHRESAIARHDSLVSDVRECLRLLDERFGCPQISAEDLDPDTRAQREWELAKRSDFPGGLDLLEGERIPAFVVPGKSRGAAAQPQPAQTLRRVRPERTHRLTHDRRPYGWAFGDHQRQAV